MKTSTDIETFGDFWPLYLRAHADTGSRAFHFLGLMLSAALAGALAASGMFFFMVLALIPAQLGAWVGHKLSLRHEHIVEENPGWAALADLKMFGLFLTGKLDAELDKYGERPSLPSIPRFSST